MTVTFKGLLLSTCFAILATGSFAQHKTKTHAKVVAKPVAGGLTTAIASGKQVYGKSCIACHQADGGGLGNMNPPLIKTPYVLGDKSRLIKIVLNGFNEEVEINGQNYQNTMPSQDYLKDEEIADVLTYVRNSFGNKAGAVKAAEVKALRGKK